MQSFLHWFLVRAPFAQLRLINNLLIIIEDLLGLHLNIKYFFSPIFGDRSFIGRILTFFFRSAVIIAGGLTFTFVSLILFLIPFLWYFSLPLTIVFPGFLLIPCFGVLYYLLISSSKPEYLLPHKHLLKNLESFCDAETKKLFKEKDPHALLNSVMQTPSVLHFMQRTVINSNSLWQEIQNKPLQHNNNEQLIKIITEHHIRQIRPVHIFYALMHENQQIFDIPLKKQQLDFDLLNKYISWEEFEYKTANPPKMWEEDYQTFTGGGTNRTWQGTVTPILNQYITDLTSHAYQNDKRVVRTEIVNQIQQALQKEQANHVILVGDIGVGKDTLVQEIAQAIATGHMQGPLWSKRIVQLDVGKLYAGGLNPSESFESRVETIIHEMKRSGNIILYLNDFNSALQAQGNGKISLFSLLQQSMNSGVIHIIGSMTPREYHTLETSAPSFLNEFTTIKVPETNPEETTHILHNETLQYENKYHLFFPFPSIETIYKHAQEYFQEGAMPQRAIKLLENITVGLRDSQKSNNEFWQTIYGKRKPVLNHDISQIVQEIIHAPVGDVEKNEADTLLNLETLFQKYVVDQTEAVSALAKALRRNRAGLRNKNKPIGSFLFVGPTGVGKTEMAKTLARIYYRGENRMLRFDMSEFKEIQSIERLIGSPQGTSVQTLTEQIKKQPFSLVLLDELEKAHPQILDLFLQVLDDGILTDGLGDTVRFNEAIIIATSNAGTVEITNQFRTITSAEQYDQIKEKIPQILSQNFRIEFLNRFDDIILFKPLTQQSVEKIVRMQLQKIADTVYQEKKIQVTFTDETIKSLVKNGYNKDLGARPLQREIQDTVESKLAIMLLQNTVQPGETIEL